MRAGRVVSLSLWLILTAIATAAGVAAHMVSSTRGLPEPLVAALFVGVPFLLILISVGFAIDRSIVGLRAHIETAPNEAKDAFGGSRWLDPITRAFTGAVDQFRQRETSLRNQLRELDIRHRVSEAERRQVEAVLNSLRDAVVVTDAFGEIAMANEAAARLFGFDLEVALHKSIDDVLGSGQLGRVIADSREGGQPNEQRHVELELEVNAPDGSRQIRVFDVTLACVENHKQEVAGVVAVLHDMTQQREVSQMKTDFVSKASHELRTPLSSIRAYVEMLVDGEAEDEESRQEFYRIIQQEANRLGRLIDNMLNISRIEAGLSQVEREEVDMGELVTRAMETLEPQAREKDITLITKVAPLDLTVEGDADMLYQVVLNLGSNAVKYTPEGGRVTISADSDNLTRSVVVTVADTGLGIPPDALPKLFDKFYRVENYKRVAKGTGLGLSLCKQIVETLHRGQIDVESKLGMGSKFWFSVPMRYAGSQAAA